VDKANSTNLLGLVSSTGASTDTSSTGDRYDHGLDTPLGGGSVVPGGIVSTPVVMGHGVLWPTGEATEGTGAGAHGPNGDIADYLIMDFGFTPAASVAGKVLEDMNGNGIVDIGDTIGVSDVTIVLQTPSGVPLATNVTDSSGAYAFANLAPSSYVVAQTVPAGWTSTAGIQIPVTLASGQNSTNNNFLDTRPASIAGSVLMDMNGNGIVDTEDTNGITGITIVLQNTNGVSLATNVTDSAGTYAFTYLAPGTYVVVQTDLLGGSTIVSSIAVSVVSGQHSAGNNFLDTQPASIAGSVLWDLNGNGMVDTEDTIGVPGVTVMLQATNGMPLATNMTDSAGAYLFGNLAPGSYVIVHDSLPGWMSTGSASGASSNQIPVTIVSAQHSTGANFLDIKLGSISGSVLVDRNGNCVLDAEDTVGISGVTVVLVTTGDVPVETTNTDANGYYLFNNVPPGDYVVVETDLLGWASTAPINNRIPLTLAANADSTGNDFLDAPGSPVANPAYYYRAKDTSLKISVTNLIAQYASQSLGDPLGLVAVQGALLTNNVIIATTTNGSPVYFANPYKGSAYIVLAPTNNLNETLPYVVNDTTYPALTATNQIIIIVTNAISQLSGSISTSGSAVTTTWAGIPGSTNDVQRNTNLLTGAGWVAIWTTNAPPAGVFKYTDDFSDLGFTPDSAYYRLRQH
jgi:uncharacterized protein (DUF2141 family)